jgi:hypothetical protein
MQQSKTQRESLYRLGSKSNIPVIPSNETLTTMRGYWNALIKSHQEEENSIKKNRLREELDSVREFIDKNKAPHY